MWFDQAPEQNMAQGVDMNLFFQFSACGLTKVKRQVPREAPVRAHLKLHETYHGHNRSCHLREMCSNTARANKSRSTCKAAAGHGLTSKPA